MHLTPENTVNKTLDWNCERSCTRKRAFHTEHYARTYCLFLEDISYGFFDLYLCSFCLFYHIYRLKEV